MLLRKGSCSALFRHIAAALILTLAMGLCTLFGGIPQVYAADDAAAVSVQLNMEIQSPEADADGLFLAS